MSYCVILDSRPFTVTYKDLSDCVARSQAMSRAWQCRSEIEWASEAIASDNRPLPAHQAVAQITLSTIEKRETSTVATATIKIDVDAPSPAEALTKALWFLDMQHPSSPALRAPAGTGIFDRSALRQSNGNNPEYIGSVPADFVQGRYLSDFSSHLGSYGQGGAGWLGFKLNEGSWMVAPLSHGAHWTWLTTETYSIDSTRSLLTYKIDRRVLECMPDQLGTYSPWQHRYAGPSPDIEDLPDFKSLRPRIDRFEVDETRFILQAQAGDTTYRFEIADHLPRPPYGGSKEDRRFLVGDNLSASLFLAHSPYLSC